MPIQFAGVSSRCRKSQQALTSPMTWNWSAAGRSCSTLSTVTCNTCTGHTLNVVLSAVAGQTWLAMASRSFLCSFVNVYVIRSQTLTGRCSRFYTFPLVRRTRKLSWFSFIMHDFSPTTSTSTYVFSLVCMVICGWVVNDCVCACRRVGVCTRA